MDINATIIVRHAMAYRQANLRSSEVPISTGRNAINCRVCCVNPITTAAAIVGQSAEIELGYVANPIAAQATHRKSDRSESLGISVGILIMI